MRNSIGRDQTAIAGSASWAGLGIAAACLVLTGCLAQKADLNKVESNLNEKIQTLDKQEKEIDRLIGETRAKLANEIRDMREEELPKFQGKLDETLYQLNALAARLDDRAVKLEKALSEQVAARKADRQHLQDELAKVNATILSMAKTVDGRLQEHDRAVAASDTLHKRTGQQLDAQNKALGALGDRIVQQDQRTDALTQKVEADGKATSAHLAEVNKSIASIAKTREAIGGKFQTKVQEQDRRLEEMAQGVSKLHTEIADLTRAVQELRMTKDHPGKKGAKQSKRAVEETTQEPRLSHPPEPSPAAEHPQQGAAEAQLKVP